MLAPTSLASRAFFGAWVIRAAFVLAVFGWGVGLYGPPIFLHAVVERTGWPLVLVSSAMTAHFLFGAFVVVNLPRAYRRFGVPATMVAGACITALGVVGWAAAVAVAALRRGARNGGGWVALGAVSVNAVIARWYERARPIALAKAYNGASIGGVVFSPLWVALIARGISVGDRHRRRRDGRGRGISGPGRICRTPEQLGQLRDGDAPARRLPM
jgi:hypothetical protein